MLFPFSLLAQNCATGKERVDSIEKSFEKEVLKFTNKERKKRGLKPFKWDEKLSYAARYHAKDMAVDDYFEHTSHDRNANGKLKEGCGTFDRIEAFVVNNYAAENISAGRTSPKAVVDSWMKSKGHRKNILNKDYTLLGIGYYYTEDSEYSHYWVQNFGGN